ncbi:hypothetical protein PV11_08746 [Exophiala sideris]|uniref:Uncharacterized protein n=1 Tax=Exophiala sideris TaxID=1016849 RepID=A0A0D1WP79_9EURO|nr:hypothetical protein PV11_08746 [Exophiala sideris]
MSGNISSTDWVHQSSYSNIDSNMKQEQVHVVVAPVPATADDRMVEDDSQPPTNYERLWRLADTWWLGEIVTWFISLLALLGIIILLRVHQDHPNPYSLIRPWHMTVRGKQYHYQIHLTVNSCLSIFATIFKATLAVPVAAALGQLK